MRLFGDIKRIRRTVDFAEEAGLAVVLPGDDGKAGFVAVEDEGGADALADVTANAAVGGDDFDHRSALLRRSERQVLERKVLAYRRHPIEAGDDDAARL